LLPSQSFSSSLNPFIWKASLNNAQKELFSTVTIQNTNKGTCTELKSVVAFTSASKPGNNNRKSELASQFAREMRQLQNLNDRAIMNCLLGEAVHAYSETLFFDHEDGEDKFLRNVG
jgi:hypothetical protein